MVENSNFSISYLFRISIFGFRIYLIYYGPNLNPRADEKREVF